MKLAFGSDHRGYDLKVELIKKVENELNVEVADFGCYNNQRCDFPLYAIKTSESVANKECDLGVVICGSGDGVCVASNKVKGIRSTLVVNKEDAKRARNHINANVLAIGSEKTNLDEAFEIVKALIKEEFLGGDYQKRIDMLTEYENK